MRTLFNYSLHQRLLRTPTPHPLPPLLLRLLLHHSHHLPPHRLQLLLPVHLPEERLLVLEPLLKLGRQLLSLFGKAFDAKVAKSILTLKHDSERISLKHIQPPDDQQQISAYSAPP